MNLESGRRRAEHLRWRSVAGKALVTGGAGFIGSHLGEPVLDGDWEVKALDDLSTRLGANPFHIYRNPYFCPSVESVLATSVVDKLVARPGVGVG